MNIHINIYLYMYILSLHTANPYIHTCCIYTYIYILTKHFLCACRGGHSKTVVEQWNPPKMIMIQVEEL